MSSQGFPPVQEGGKPTKIEHGDVIQRHMADDNSS